MSQPSRWWLYNTCGGGGGGGIAPFLDRATGYSVTPQTSFCAMIARPRPERRSLL